MCRRLRAHGTVPKGLSSGPPRQASQKKILRDVFAKGDVCIRTGDLLRMDQFQDLLLCKMYSCRRKPSIRRQDRARIHVGAPRCIVYRGAPRHFT